MSDVMRMTGLYSGMDTESIVQQLVSAKQTKVTNLKNEQTKLEWKQTAWQDLNSKIYSLYSGTLSKLRLSTAYKKKTTTSSDPTKVNVLASEGAVDGTQTLKINSIAKSGYLTGAKLDSTKTEEVEENGKKVTKKVGWKATDKLSEINSGLAGKSISVTVGTGDEEKTTAIEITSDMTISQFTSKLKEAGVNASFDENNQRFFISATGSGAKKDFKLSGSDVALQALGLDDTFHYANGSECVKNNGQDAEIVLNGATFTSDTNAFSINGLTLNVTGTTEDEISIVTSTDYDGVYDTIKDFITEYNELINEIDKLYNADSARKYNMLTEDEKESMSDEEVEKWEGTIKGSLLRKDSSLSTVMNSLINTMMGSYYTNNLTEEQKKTMTESEISAWYEKNGNKKSLYDFGIKTLSYFDAKDNEHHAYHIDGNEDDENTSTKTDKLKAALANDPEGTTEFFTALCKEMYNKINDAMNSNKDYSSVYKVYNDKQLKKEYDNYTKRIKEAEEELNDYEDKWYDKFAAMETALAKLQSNTNAVTSMLGS